MTVDMPCIQIEWKISLKGARWRDVLYDVVLRFKCFQAAMEHLAQKIVPPFKNSPVHFLRASEPLADRLVIKLNAPISIV